MRRGARGFRKTPRAATGGGAPGEGRVQGRLPSEPGRVFAQETQPGAGVSVNAVDSVA